MLFLVQGWHVHASLKSKETSLSSLQKMTCYFDNCICYQNCNCDMVLRDDAMLALCDSHLWARQCSCPLWSTATIELRPQYKDPCHCKSWLATLTTLWLPYVYFGIRDWLHKTPARLLVQISSLTILGTPTRSLQLSRHGNFHALMATGDSLTDV